MSQEILKAITRRQFFHDCRIGIGALALANLINDGQPAQANPIDSPLTIKPPHFQPKAKRVIFLHMVGAPSQLDLFDYKPTLNELHGQPCPESMTDGERFAFIRGTPTILGSPYKFKKHGQCGTEVSELLPHTSEIVDDIAIIRSMHTDQFNHGPAEMFLHTGHFQPGRPSLGSWLSYGLGTENQDLPGFVVLITGNQPSAGCGCWGSGFLPSVYQGVEFRSQGEPVLFTTNPAGVNDEIRRQTIEAVNDLNRLIVDKTGDSEINTRISQYEMAYRMQSSVPELADITSEPDYIHEMYGTKPGETSFANNCLLARRLVERGVRFVQLYDWGWDSHGTSPGDDIVTSLAKQTKATDQAVAALIKDLKQRGMLEDTLVIWGGEFGRTPMNEARNGSKFLGRDHHPRAYTMWMAGGGVKPGITVGKTDEFGYLPVEDPVHVHDLQATILHLMGLDHTQLTYRFQGRDFRLTDVHGNVVKKVLA